MFYLTTHSTHFIMFIEPEKIKPTVKRLSRFYFADVTERVVEIALLILVLLHLDDLFV